jgi:hypothetical protein
VGLRDRLQLVYDCWSLLELPDGTSRRPAYLPRGVEEPELCYQRRLTAARPSGFFRDAQRTYAGMLSRLRWLVPLPDSLSRVLTDVDGNGTDLGVVAVKAIGWRRSAVVIGCRCRGCSWCPAPTC